MDNHDIRYELIEGSYTVESETHIGYGIALKNMINGKCISFHDISIEKKDILKLISLCNELQLDPIHIRDVIDDFLVSH